jgi:NitT/TauT family transport system permease protein
MSGVALQPPQLHARRDPRLLAGGFGLMRGVMLRAAGFVAGLCLLGGVWEAYKAWGPSGGAHLLGMAVLPRTNDTAMPHLWTIWNVLGQPDAVGSQQTLSFGPSSSTSSGGKTVLGAIAGDCFQTFQWAAVGFLFGLLVGMGLALLLDRSRLIQRAALPYLVASQTVPLVALAPILAQWDGSIQIGGWTWSNGTSIELVAAYLAFFPISIGMLRGLRSATAVQNDLFTCTAASWRQTLVRLKLPTSVPHLLPALRLAAAASVVGAIVAEISIGQGSIGAKSGIGTRIWEYSQQSDSSRLYAAVIAAALLGLLVTALVALFDLALYRYNRLGVRG